MSNLEKHDATRGNKRVSRILLKIVLRSIPLVPAPDLFYELISELKSSKNTIDGKIEEANESLKQTSMLINEIEQILTERSKKLAVLREEVEKYSQLAEVEELQARAIVKQLEQAVSRGQARERWVSFIINLIAGTILFIFGIFASPFLTKLIGG